MTKSSNNILAKILLSLLVIYLLKGFLYPTGVISVTVASVITLLCFILGVKNLRFKQKSNIIDILYIIFCIVTVCYIISPKIVSTSNGYISTFAFFRDFCGALLPSYAMYYLVRKGYVTFKSLHIFFYAFFTASIIAFFYETLSYMVEINKENVTSNSAYRFVYLMPFVVFLRGNIKILILWIIALIIAVLSVKRGAILGLSLEFLTYYIWKFKNSRKKVLYIITDVISSAIGWHYLYKYYSENTYMQMRFEATLEGNTSDRDYLSAKMSEYFDNEGIFEKMLGTGFANTTNIAGNYAHSDWMEMLIDCGVLGLTFYALFYFYFIRSIYSTKSNIRKLLFLIFIAFFPTSFFSMVFFSESSSIGFLWLGFAIGLKDAAKFHNTYNETSNLLRLG